MEFKYILDLQGNPIPCSDSVKWAEWFEKADRCVGLDDIGPVTVSTVFFGINLAFREGPPLLYETMVFGGEYNHEGERYTTRQDAEAGHRRWVEKVRKLSAG